MAKRPALGRGIGALIPPTNRIPESKVITTQEASTPGVESNMIDISLLVRNEDQPRKTFDEKELAELAASITENGVISPIVVRRKEKKFEIIAGERRYRASKLAGLDKIPVVIKERITEKEVKIISIIENVQRSDLNCVEEATAYFNLMNDFNLTQDEVAKKIGKERSTITNFMRVLNLPKTVREHLTMKTLSFGHAKVLASVKERELCIRLANQVVTKKLSVRELEKMIKAAQATKKASENKFFDEKLDQFKSSLEKKTGFHFDLKSKKNGAGEVILKYTNEAEFNDIYEFLLKK